MPPNDDASITAPAEGKTRKRPRPGERRLQILQVLAEMLQTLKTKMLKQMVLELPQKNLAMQMLNILCLCGAKTLTTIQFLK
jgi:hypothetical protein